MILKKFLKKKNDVVILEPGVQGIENFNFVLNNACEQFVCMFITFNTFTRIF